MAKEYIEECNGSYYVAGSRVSLDSIVRCFNERLSPETIVEEFEVLTLAQVYGAIAFYLENRPAVDAYRVRQQHRFDAMRSHPKSDVSDSSIHNRQSEFRASSSSP